MTNSNNRLIIMTPIKEYLLEFRCEYEEKNIRHNLGRLISLSSNTRLPEAAKCSTVTVPSEEL